MTRFVPIGAVIAGLGLLAFAAWGYAFHNPNRPSTVRLGEIKLPDKIYTGGWTSFPIEIFNEGAVTARIVGTNAC